MYTLLNKCVGLLEKNNNNTLDSRKTNEQIISEVSE